MLHRSNKLETVHLVSSYLATAAERIKDVVVSRVIPGIGLVVMLPNNFMPSPLDYRLSHAFSAARGFFGGVFFLKQPRGGGRVSPSPKVDYCTEFITTSKMLNAKSKLYILDIILT